MPLADPHGDYEAPTTFDTSSAGLDLLLFDESAEADTYVEVLRYRYSRIGLTRVPAIALQCLKRTTPTLVIAGLKADDQAAIEICKAAKTKQMPPSVLVTAQRAEDVPEALQAGCDGVLLKPFPPSLLINRISLMLRRRSEQLRLVSVRARSKSAHLTERVELLKAGTNRDWPSVLCPYCGHQGVTSFDYASLRRAWYACLECRKVWIGKRLDT